MSRIWVVMVVLAIASSSQATIWVCDFTSAAPESWTGSDLTAVANYADTMGANPRSYSVTFNNNDSGFPAGWLTQGARGGVATTAKFSNVADGKRGRDRFSTALPASMDLAEGISLAWEMRVGTDNITRGPIQIGATVNGSAGGGSTQAFNAYIRLRNSGHSSGNSYIDIQRNGGGLYNDLTGTSDPLRVATLVLDRNLADEYHVWSAAIKHNPEDNKAYWKLWLDGQQLLFGGSSGSPVWAGEQWSFRTFQETFTGAEYIGLGELNLQDLWDFEFDWVNYRDDGAMYFIPEPASLALLTLGSCCLAARRRRVG